MGRRSLDQMPQAQLAQELRHAIDRARRRPSDTRAVTRVLDLLRDNPRSAASTHVAHNLGSTRLAWLAARAGGPPWDPSDDRSLGPKEVPMVRDNPDLQKTVTNVGPDQQDQAREIAQEHAKAVADEVGRHQEQAVPTTIRGDAEPEKKG
jgi:hypothetical protein